MSFSKFSSSYGSNMFSLTDHIQTSGLSKEKRHLDRYVERKIQIDSKNIKLIKPSGALKEEGDAILNQFTTIVEKRKTIPIASNKRRKKVNNKFFKELSKGISFTEDVVEERSPHTIPYSQCAIAEIYHASKIVQRKPAITHNIQCLNTKSRLPMISSGKKCDDHIEKTLSTDSFLFGLEESADKLKSLTQRIKLGQPINKEMVLKSPCQHGWEEYVLSHLSRTTADLILKDFSSAHKAERLRQLLDIQEKDKEVNLNNRHMDENLKESKGNEHPVESQNDRIKIGDSSVFFKDILEKSGKRDAEKHIQPVYPYSPLKWFDNYKSGSKHIKTGRLTKGMQKWTGYPTYKEEELILQQVSDTKLCEKSLNKMKGIYAKKDNSTLIPLVNEWRNKWLLERKWLQKPLEDLQKGMRDINDHIRFAAVSAIGAALLEERQINCIVNDPREPVFEELILCDIIRLLDDSSPYVCLAAAVTLFCINRAVTKASDILMQNVKDGEPSERWISVQCLAEYDYHEDCIIKELILHLKSNDNLCEKAIQILRKLSHLTASIHYMIGEKLNSASWEDRVIACQVLPTLDGKLGKDIVNKLSSLVWNDWSGEVRAAAAVALGKSGNGKLLHSSLYKRLKSKNCNKQINALKKISSLGIMTSHLLEPLISCFQSDNNAVCLQAIKTCSRIKINDERILNILIGLIDSDRPCKLKVYTLRAFGYIGCRSPLIRDKLLFTLHFNKVPALRKEACTSITKLCLQDEEIIKILQDLVVIDEDPSVRNEVVVALNSMGLQAVGDITLIETIKESVKKLCHKDNIIAHILREQEERSSEYSTNSLKRNGRDELTTAISDNVTNDYSGYEFSHEVEDDIETKTYHDTRKYLTDDDSVFHAGADDDSFTEKYCNSENI